ncbi:hypothetical protein E8P82_01610 [Arthrobacter echini]|uniref:Thiopeptide-type bacteriocin biosynthesis domain-containing protein n=1 Tax=Arthrobacter echini TaxID=1529066 RepID=A0A4S5EA74_9MICC|nr:lantibiotic dehydratase C-terminal domain-containing protein [Arthrobacter echini]THJ68626.1 hypothetical protein E8P82_01610 [Arthrobacter echini]
MSQVTAARTASRTVVATQWWHVSLSTGGFDAVDGIIEELITPLVARAQKYGAKRWYFTRSSAGACSMGGVELSIHAHPRVLERLRSFHEARLSTRSGTVPVHAHQYLTTPASETYYAGGQRMADPRLEAHLVRYGGVEGLHLAEEVLELGSELAIWAIRRFPRKQSRSAFAAVLLFDAAQSMMAGAHSGRWTERQIAWSRYWDSHLHRCTADAGQHAARASEAMTARVATKTQGFHALMVATSSESSVQRWRRRWYRALDTYLYRAERASVSRSAMHLTMCQAHMMLNRLGFGSGEEAALGLYARTSAPGVSSGCGSSDLQALRLDAGRPNPRLIELPNKGQHHE